MDEGGDENYRLVKVNVTDGRQQRLTEPGTRTAVKNKSLKQPELIVIAMNDEDPR